MIRMNRKRRLVYPVTVSDLVGNVIRRKRLYYGVTQEGLADMIGVTRTHICNIEAGRLQMIGLDLLWDIAAALGVDTRSLIPTIEELALENRNAKRRKR